VTRGAAEITPKWWSVRANIKAPSALVAMTILWSWVISARTPSHKAKRTNAPISKNKQCIDEARRQYHEKQQRSTRHRDKVLEQSNPNKNRVIGCQQRASRSTPPPPPPLPNLPVTTPHSPRPSSPLGNRPTGTRN
jgi:hypothetical protein